MQLMRWRLIGSTVDGLGELTMYADEDRRGVDVHVGNLACFCGKMVALSKRKANGRSHLHLLGSLVYCNGTAMNVLSGEETLFFVFIVMRLTDALLHKIHVKPYLVMAALISLPNAKSFVENGKLRNPHTSATHPEPPLDPTMVWGLEASARHSRRKLLQ